MSSQNTPDDQNVTARPMPVTIHAQYIKDLSFENPNAPQILKSSAGAPDLQMTIDVGLKNIDDPDFPGLFEVSLRLRGHARRNEKTAFIAEVEHAASVTLGDALPEESRHPFLLIEIPRLLFPFARQAIADLSHQGGFPALLLSPVDFQALYMQKFARQDGAAPDSQSQDPQSVAAH